MKLRRRARGSTFILVLAMLTILVFLVSALSYTSRLESITSYNYAQVVQSRTAAATGLPLALALLIDTTTITTPLQRWNQAPMITGTLGPPEDPGARRSSSRAAGRNRGSLFGREASATSPDGSATAARAGSGARRNDDSAGTTMPLRNGQAVVGIADLSSKVNINTVRSEEALERFLEQVFKQQGRPSASGGPVAARAQRVFSLRGESEETTRSVEGDLRIPPPEGTARFESLSDLQVRPRRGKTGATEGLFTKDELAVLQRYVTTFSQAPEIFRGGDGFSQPRLSIHDLSAGRVWNALSLAFPEKDPRLLLQFAANVADFADEDSIPTYVLDPASPEPWNAIFGVEQTPVITEVYPDSVSGASFGDGGQYVEIFNPWAEAISVEGWMLTVGSTNGGANSVRLSGTIQSGGYLIVTDNYESPPSDAPPGEGSFLSVFGARRDDGSRRLLDQSGFSLPDRNSMVALLDAGGRLTDVFAYTDDASRDSRDAYQRDDPRVRAFRVADATPFGQAPEGAHTGGSDSLALVRRAWESGNKPIESIVDLFRVSTAYAGIRKADAGTRFEIRGWQSPVYQHLGPAEIANLDAGLLDLFTTVRPPVAAEENETTGAKEKAARVAAVAESSDIDSAEVTEGRSDKETTWPLLHSHGKVNLNTCEPVALYSLDAEMGGFPVVTEAVVSQFESHRRSRLGTGEAPYLRPSEFVLQVIPRLDNEEQAKAIGLLLDQVTVSSSAFDVLAENITEPAGGGAPAAQSGTRTKVFWRVALDQAPFSLIGYSVEP